MLPDAKMLVARFFGRVTEASSPADFAGDLLDPHITLDIVGRTAISGHYAGVASIFNVLVSLLRQRLAAASFRIVNSISTPSVVAVQLELRAVTRDGGIYNPRASHTTLVLRLRDQHIVHARLWVDTEQVERVLFGNDFR